MLAGCFLRFRQLVADVCGQNSASLRGGKRGRQSYHTGTYFFSFRALLTVHILSVQVLTGNQTRQISSICDACVLICQIQYSGGKHYRDAAGVVLKLTDAKGEVIISKTDQTAVIDGLVPMTPYTFNIRARFADGTWGPRSTVQAETLPDGMPSFVLCILCKKKNSALL